MLRENKLSLILPCHNEEAAVAIVLSKLLAEREELLKQGLVSDFEIIVIDDASTDNSWQELLAFSSAIRLHRTTQRMGYGAVLKQGFALASGDLLAFYDLDNTYCPSNLSTMLRKLYSDQLDMVVGDRLSPMESMPFTRYLGNSFFKFFISIVFWQKIQDSCSGFRVLRKEYLDCFVTYLPDNLNFSLSMTLLFLHFERPFAEIPNLACHHIHFADSISFFPK